MREQDRPNVLLITTDQQHWNTIHALGNGHIKTPNLDRLVREGMAFSRAYVTNPVCSPSRSSILTGEYPSRHGCWNIGVELDENRTTLPKLLNEAGYATGLFGKAHFKPVLDSESLEGRPHIHKREFWKSWHGPYYGFQHVDLVHGHADEVSSHGMHYGVWLEEQGINPDLYFGPNGGFREGDWDLPERYHYTRWTADRTVEFIDNLVKDKDEGSRKPFFAWCSFQDPHNAFLCPGDWDVKYSSDELPEFHEREGEMDDKPLIHRLLIEGRLDELDIKVTADPGHATGGIQCLGMTNDGIGYERARQWLATYYSMISLIDHHIGRILNSLEEMNLLNDTVIIFTSDHGDYAGNHGLWLKGPIHYEDLIRVPLIVRDPNVEPQNTRSSALFSLVDLAPTILDICQVEPPLHMQGVSQLPSIEDPTKHRRDWCLVENRAEPEFYVKTVVNERYKLNYFLARNEGELYDLENDPDEFINLFNSPGHREVKMQMMTCLVDALGSLENHYPPRKSFA